MSRYIDCVTDLIKSRIVFFGLISFLFHFPLCCGATVLLCRWEMMDLASSYKMRLRTKVLQPFCSSVRASTSQGF